MLGGPAFGPNSLVKIIKHYGWDKVVVYFQNSRQDVASSETFASIALAEGIEFDLRESAGAGAVEADLKDLQAAKSNIFILFGGLQRVPLRLEKAAMPSGGVCDGPLCRSRVLQQHGEKARSESPRDWGHLLLYTPISPCRAAPAPRHLRTL